MVSERAGGAWVMGGATLCCGSWARSPPLLLVPPPWQAEVDVVVAEVEKLAGW